MPAGATYEPIATASISAQTSYTFSSISGSYTDLRLVYTGANGTTAKSILVQINGDTGINYSWTELYGNGTSAASYQASNYDGINSYNTFGTQQMMMTWDFMSYAGSTNKTILWTQSGDNNGSGFVTRGVALWRNTAAITSIKIFPGSGNFTGTATLYGIKAA